MANIFDVSEFEITPDSSPDEIDGWDSLHHMKLVLSLEKEYGITFRSDEVEKMLSYKSILETLKKHGV